MTKKRHRGFSMSELLVALVVMSVLLTIVGQYVVLVACQQRTVSRRHLALQEIANAMEWAFASPFERLDEGSLDDWRLSAAGREYLPGARVKTEISESAADGIVAKRIRLELHWRDRGGGPQRVGLTAWRYRAAQEPDG